MVATQKAWVSPLSSAACGKRYCISAPALLIHLPEHFVGSCSLGDVVHVIGHASVQHSTPQTGCRSSIIEIQVNNLQQILPHNQWLLPPAAAARLTPMSQQPLHNMWGLLNTALGYHTQLDPHLATAMLLSAAAVSKASSSTRQPGQVNLLVLHEAFSPSTPRLLREAAALLSPQSVAMPVQQAEHVVPITGGSGPENAANTVFASILQLANTGIAVAELALMTKKSKVQLLQALQQHRTPVPKDLPQGLGLLPCTVTCWAAAAWQEVAPATNDATLHSSRGAAATRPTYAGFDVCIGDGTVHEDDLWGILSQQASSSAEMLSLQQSQVHATQHLRHIIATAAHSTRPVLSEAAQAFLGQYFLMVRQSVDGSSHVSKPQLLGSLVAVASASARLHQRNAVLECPDATLAVLLMEQTLTNKLGSAYQSMLSLPCDLNTSNDRTLDEQVLLLHSSISRIFRQSGVVVPGTSSGGVGVTFDGQELSGAVGCNGAGGLDDWGVVEPEE